MFMPINLDKRYTEVTLTGEIKWFGAGELNIRYDYSNVMVGAETEKEFLNKKVQELNEKVEGKGNNYLEEWFTARKEKYEPKFEEILNRWGPRVGVAGTNYTTSAPVTILVKTLNVEPGFNAVVAKKYCFITVQIIFLDANDKEMFVYKVQDVQGGDIRACYGGAAHFFMKKFTKELKRLEKNKK